MLKHCKRCGEEFTGGSVDKFFCNAECKRLARWERLDQKYIGQKFGMLTIVRRHPDPKTKYVCLCDCGNETIVRPSAIKAGETISCGCHRREVGKRMAKENGVGVLELIAPGTRFGRLEVIEFVGTKPSVGSFFRCKCDCGKENVVSRSSLKSGLTKSCGCLHREVAAENLRRARFKHGLSNDRAYLTWVKRQRYKDEQYWTYQMEAALRNLQPACVVCGSTNDQCVDHVFPFSKGGKMIPGNVVILCRQCNTRKLDRTLEELDPETAKKIADAAYDYLHYWRQVRNTMESFKEP